MEDSVTESEMKREIERKQGDKEEEEEEEEEVVVPSKRDEEMMGEGSFMNKFISKSREIYEGRTDHGGEKMEEEENHSGEGIINKISNFFHQENENEGEERETKRGKRSEEVGEEEVKDEKDFGKGDLELDNGGAGAGVGRINNLISNFFHQNEGEGGGGEEEKGTNSDQELINGREQESKMKVEGENGGIINNLVSNLTASLPDNSVPANDEASILIHSIIHD